MPLVDDCSDGSPAVATLADAPAKGHGLELDRELDGPILRVRCDDSVHGIVLTGAGERVSRAGADRAMLERAAPRHKDQFRLPAGERRPVSPAGPRGSGAATVPPAGAAPRRGASRPRPAGRGRDRSGGPMHGRVPPTPRGGGRDHQGGVRR